MADLTKRDLDYPRLRIHCAECDGRADGYTIVTMDGILNFNIYCHGKGHLIRVGPNAIDEFWAEINAYREGEEGLPFVVFGRAPAEQGNLT